MGVRYSGMAAYIRERMDVCGFRNTADLTRALHRAKCNVGESMVGRYVKGTSRAEGPRLEALLDVLGAVRKEDRDAAYIAYHQVDTQGEVDDVEPVTTS